MLKKIVFAVTVAISALGQTFANSVTFSENFSSSPAENGWKIFGDSSLFGWNSTNQNLEVTWDSAKPNSYFFRSLGTTLAKDDSFNLAFDLRLNDIAIGVNTNKPFAFQIAVGFQNSSQAAQSGFHRGHGFEAPNLAEFNYFPDSGFGNTISTPIISTNNGYANGGFTVGLELTPNDLFHIEMSYAPSNQTLKTFMTKNGAPFGPIEDTVLDSGFSDFRLDAVAIASYSDAGQIPEFGEGSVLAHGVVDNISVTVPELPIGQLFGRISENAWQVEVASRTNWTYVLERSCDLQIWTNASPVISGTGTNLFLNDPSALGDKAFYRVRAERP